jgi:hypothetical protein
LPGPDDVQGPGTSRATSIAFANTPVGTYTVVVNVGAGNLAHSWTFKLVVVHQLTITSELWKGNVHTFANAAPQFWNVTISNPAGNPTLNLLVTVSGQDPTGTITFSNSTTLTIAGNSTVTVTLTASFVGLVPSNTVTTFTFSTVVLFGVAKPTGIATPLVRTSGSFGVKSK